MAQRVREDSVDTASRILDVAERLVQSRGFNGFSYADVAAELNITKASLHYHFPTKAALGEALIARYAARFAEALVAIDGRLADPREKLHAYAGLYADVLQGERMCLCGMLAAEYQTLPEPMRDEVIGFFNDNEAWLVSVLSQGQADHLLELSGPPGESRAHDHQRPGGRNARCAPVRGPRPLPGGRRPAALERRRHAELTHS